ncbi:phosphate uptake regulator PhoU [Candidatus Woesearchaeota archaeon]|nr:phosphate uptake regulator PhoU [Candidatus Woesearchaeota archaeon]
MIRKVIQLAGKTLVVSLPSKWAKGTGINKGSEVTVEEKGDKIIISSAAAKAGLKTEADITGTVPMTKRVLGAIFKLGYEEVVVRFSSSEELAMAQEVIREEFIGFEVVKRSKNLLHIKSVTQLDPNEFPTILRRTFLALLGMAEESLVAAKKGDKLWLQTIALTDKDINKYADFCRRLLNQKGLSVAEKPLPMYYIVEQLERIGDSYRDICKAALEGEKMSLSAQKIHAELTAFFRMMYDCYYKFSLQKMAEVGKKKEALKKKLRQAFATAKKSELQILILLDKLTDDIYDMNGAVMAVML